MLGAAPRMLGAGACELGTSLLAMMDSEEERTTAS